MVSNLRFIILLVLIPGLGNALIGQSRVDSMIIFIGQKIEINDITPDPNVEINTKPDSTWINRDTIYANRNPKFSTVYLDSKYHVKYKIIDLVNGRFEGDTIEFIAYDHYGIPGFSNYENVLLFVNRMESGELVHEKYQYADLYKARNGRWASPYSSYDYSYPNVKDKFKPRKIQFEGKIEYEISPLINPIDINTYFPSPYYRRRENKAIAVYGHYLDELIKIKKFGIVWRYKED